ncbi:MAG: type II toxin-antitoxin system HicA family toxin [Nitrospirae bacterium]|nr:type II toxin-antitoxin system HicA family toxin [Nitrospirota bacterium]
MSKATKLLIRFLAKPKDFTFAELSTFLSHMGYHEAKGGKTSGSAVSFINDKTHHIIRLHKPHPKPELKRYQLNDIEEELKKKGVI